METSSEPATKKKKRKKSEKCKICGEKGHRKMDCENLPEERRKELQELYKMKVERKGKGTGRKKNKNKDVHTLPYENTKCEKENLENTEASESLDYNTSRFTNKNSEPGGTNKKAKKVKHD